MPKVIGIIPSRYDSKRFPGKPLALLDGIPIIVRVYQQAQKATVLDDLFVAADDQRIADAVDRYGGKATIVTGGFTCGSERVAAAARDLKADIVINIQGDEPLLAPGTIEKVADCLIDNPKAVMSTACCPFNDIAEMSNINMVKTVLARDGRALYFSRNPIPWFSRDMSDWTMGQLRGYHHVGLYGFTAEFLQVFASLEQTVLEKTEQLEQLRALEHGYDIHCVIVKQIFSGIDTQEDLFNAEKIMGSMR